MFEQLKRLPPDPILGLLTAFREDTRQQKIDLGVGVYQTEQGETPIMRAVVAAETHLLHKETTKTYQGIAGDPLFNERLRDLLFGADHVATGANRIRGVQTPGGCGALRIGAEVIRRARSEAAVWVTTPTWANHRPLIGGAELRIEQYPYYDVERSRVDFDAMMIALAKVKAGDVVLLHGGCHNPTGADLDRDQWIAVTDLALKNGFTPYVDVAYQGLADGVEDDAWGTRYITSRVPESLVAASCSKNFGLYRERAGAVFFIANDAGQADNVLSQAMNAARQIYSMPPAHGAAIVSAILGDAELRRDWEAELSGVRNRINAMRSLLSNRLAGNAAGIDFSFIARQKGMFSFLGIRPGEVTRLRQEFGVYMIEPSRINLAGINNRNIDYLSTSINAVLQGR